MSSRHLLALLAAVAVLAAGCGTVDSPGTGADGGASAGVDAVEVGSETADEAATGETDEASGTTGPTLTTDVQDHDDPSDHEWSEDDASTISLDGSSATVDGTVQARAG